MYSQYKQAVGMSVLLVTVLLSLMACSPPEPVVETVIVERTVVSEIPITVEVVREVEVTREVIREIEKVVTATPRPTTAPTPAPARSMEDVQADLAGAIVSDLEKLDDVERVNLARFDTGLLEIELSTIWAGDDMQPEVSWKIINLLADPLAQTEPGQRLNLTGSEELTIHLTTYSTFGDDRYQSETDYATMVKLANRSLSYEEWVQVANAGFR